MKRLFGKSVDEAMDELEHVEEYQKGIREQPQISDVLCTRDSYFHSCWLRMKLLRPELLADFREIELYVAGIDTSIDKEESEEEGEEHGTII